MRLQRKWLIRGGLALAAVALVAYFARPDPIEVEIAAVETKPLDVTIDEDGRTRAVDRYVITAPVSGRLERIDIREGDCVSAGDVIARIQPMPLDASTREQFEARLSAARARQRAAAATLERTRSARDQAAREWERRRRLAEDGAIAREQVEQYAPALATREQELQEADEANTAAASEVDAVQASLLSERSTNVAVPVRAPADGTTLRIPERSSRIVQAGEVLLEIGDPAALEVIVDVLTTDAVRIRPGMPASLGGWGGPTAIPARVRTIEPSAFTRTSALGVDEQRVNVILDLEERPETLGEGYRVEASILVWAAENVITVPTSALFRAGTRWQVFVIDDGRARLRDVTVGERSGVTAQIIDGVTEGEFVLAFPSDEVRNGDRVKPAGS
jgi:HlyD family secretion protein